jgi:hypothetical protein
MKKYKPFFYWQEKTWLPVKLLRCMRCHQPVTLYGSIGQTLLHAPTAMLYHWNMIQFHDEQNH